MATCSNSLQGRMRARLCLCLLVVAMATCCSLALATTDVTNDVISEGPAAEDVEDEGNSNIPNTKTQTTNDVSEADNMEPVPATYEDVDFDYDEFFALFGTNDTADWEQDVTGWLLNFEIVLHVYATPAILACAIVANAASLVILASLTQTRDCHAYCLLACAVNTVIFIFHPRTIAWVSGKLHSNNYMSVLKDSSEASCVTLNFLSSFTSELPRYLLLCLAVDSARALCRSRPSVGGLGGLGERGRAGYYDVYHERQAKDVIILVTTLLVICNVHYFWTYGKENIATGSLLLFRKDRCQLNTRFMSSSGERQNINGYIINGYIWAVEDLVPFISITTTLCIMLVCGPRRASRCRCCSIISSSSSCWHRITCCCLSPSSSWRHRCMRCSCVQQSGDSEAVQPCKLAVAGADVASTCDVTSSLSAGYSSSSAGTPQVDTGKDTLPLAASPSMGDKSTVHLHRITRTRYKSDAEALLRHTAPALCAVYVITHSPRVTVTMATKALAMHDPDHIGSTVELVLEVCAELVELLFYVAFFATFLIRHPGFRRHLCRLLHINRSGVFRRI